MTDTTLDRLLTASVWLMILCGAFIIAGADLIPAG